MAAITMGTSLERAQRRFPRSRGRICGSGDFALVFKCSVPWRVNLYGTAEARDQAWERTQFSSCGAYRCTHDHDRTNL